MAINFPNGLNITVAEPVDSRLVLTKVEMLAIKKAKMPDKYICLCKDDNQLYIYDKSVEKDPEIGYFRLYETPISVADLSAKLPDALTQAMQQQPEELAGAVAKTLPDALADVMSTPEGAEQIVETMFNTAEFQKGVDNKIELALEVIQAIDGNK